MCDEMMVLESAARTATTNSAEIVNLVGARGILLYLDVTAKAASPNISAVSIAVPVGATWKVVYTWGSLSIADVSQSTFCVYPGAASAASWTAAPLQGPLPRRFRVTVTHDDADSITYSLRADLVP
jgi:hypothetical protein